MNRHGLREPPRHRSCGTFDSPPPRGEGVGVGGGWCKALGFLGSINVR